MCKRDKFNLAVFQANINIAPLYSDREVERFCRCYLIFRFTHSVTWREELRETCFHNRPRNCQQLAWSRLAVLKPLCRSRLHVSISKYMQRGEQSVPGLHRFCLPPGCIISGKMIYHVMINKYIKTHKWFVLVKNKIWNVLFMYL